MEPILVTPTELAKGRGVFPPEAIEAPREEADLAAAVRRHRARAVVVGIQRYAGPLYDALAEVAAGRGSLIARFGVGHDGVDKRQAAGRGIIVTNTPGVLDASVAEQTVWLMGTLARKVSALEADFRAGRFQGQTGTELCGKTLVLLGFGGIARAVARIAGRGLGMRVVAIGRRTEAELAAAEGRPVAELAAACGIERYTDDVGAIAEADVLSIHLPATPQTARLVDAAALARLRPTALLVNTARGSIVDERALYDALASGRLAGAALDVFEREPYVPAEPQADFRSLANVVLTPHIGSNTFEANRRMAERSLANVRHFLEGRLDLLDRVAVD